MCQIKFVIAICSFAKVLFTWRCGLEK